MLLIIDNYDSFTYNLAYYFNVLGENVQVFRNDVLTISAIEDLDPQQIVISPGPGSPQEAGFSLDVIRYFSGKLPILGVCLGHQAISLVFGSRVVQARKVMHGKTSLVFHKDTGIFKGLSNPLTVTRYHSLLVSYEDFPIALEVTSWTSSMGICEIMGLRHKIWNIEGVQFHPESILSEHGYQLLNNFLLQTGGIRV
ncbi:MAG: Anthranilate/para-aminobenzoate synthases component II [Candidatus Tokpelaia sp. JSC161]|jgi:anthranilate synthase component 2|nr:MAG: Anthranilate/para-aminobenzoate synthases component II [Candidatus Tokpelaia sp. JSC161]